MRWATQRPGRGPLGWWPFRSLSRRGGEGSYGCNDDDDDDGDGGDGDGEKCCLWWPSWA